MRFQFDARASARGVWPALCVLLVVALTAPAAALAAATNVSCHPLAANCPMSAEEADRYVNYFLVQCMSDPRQCRGIGPQFDTLANGSVRNVCADKASCAAAKNRAKAVNGEYQNYCSKYTRVCDPYLKKALETREQQAIARERQCATAAGCRGSGP